MWLLVPWPWESAAHPAERDQSLRRQVVSVVPRWILQGTVPAEVTDTERLVEPVPTFLGSTGPCLLPAAARAPEGNAAAVPRGWVRV